MSSLTENSAAVFTAGLRCWAQYLRSVKPHLQYSLPAILRKKRNARAVFSQEVPAARIAAKIISRNLYQSRKSNGGADGANCLLNENQLMSCANLHLWEKQKKEFEGRASNLFVVDKVCSAREIADTVHDFVQSRKENGMSAVPFVIVDYLQILPPSKI